MGFLVSYLLKVTELMDRNNQSIDIVKPVYSEELRDKSSPSIITTITDFLAAIRTSTQGIHV